ncbi:MAG: M23 family metallopeptidase [Anaerolineae bacterium]|nr:M23 family metallopeptidase [Anaerolineae bacterium]
MAEASASTREAQIVAKSVAETATPMPPVMPTAVPTMTPTAVIEPTRPLPVIQNPTDSEFLAAADAAGKPLVVVDGSNTGVWQYPEDTFVHPISFEIRENTAYLIDAGRVLFLDLVQPEQAEVLLQSGDVVDGVTVIEPIDLHIAPDGLLVLDRAGDVYRYDWQSKVWLMDRYDRPISDTSSHYYVALDGEENGRYLLETSYNYAMLYENGERQSLWNLPEARGIDLSAMGDSVYVLEQHMDDTEAMLTLYESTSTVDVFRPDIKMDQARQVVASSAGRETAVYVLDKDGNRLLTFSPQNGQLQNMIQLPQNAEISAFTVHPQSGNLLFAGKNRLYFFEQPEKIANVSGQPLLTGTQPHDPAFLASISGFAPPIGWDITTRDLQMPGAPRHYRLGVHQGADFYWARDSQIFAAADGVVIRAMHDYTPPFPAAFYEMRNQAYELGYTSEEALDFYRGQQVWLEHENGLISRYIHLGSIAWDLEEGQHVTKGQFIGTVGNSGSPASLESPDSDAHLHFELWLGDHYLGQFLRPVETRDWVNAILHN